jgi:GH43 family beta-xylosidase
MRASFAARSVVVERLEKRQLLSGLTGQYFDRVDFTDLKLSRTDPTVNFNWGSGAPAASMNADQFSVRWTGQVQPQYTRDYTFYVSSDDGARLWVDGRLLVDNWVRQSATEKSARIALQAGQRYDIRLDYYDGPQLAQVNLSWSSASQPKQIIPSSRLFPSPSGLSATFFDNIDFTGKSVQRIDPNIDDNFGVGSPDPSIGADTFSARWTGSVVPQYSQTYSFFISTETGASAQLRVDGQLVVDTTSVQDSGQIALEAGVRYNFELDYAHNTGSSLVQLRWGAPSLTQQVVPAGALFTGANTAVPTEYADYTNSVYNHDQPDPGVIWADGYYWMTHTTGGPTTGWPLYRSTNLQDWTFQNNLLTTANIPSFMNSKFWAPEVHRVNGQYVATGTAYSNAAGHTVIAIATAPEITGPYTVRATPIVGDTVGVLDSTIFQDFDGRVYLIWKRQSNSSTAQHGSIRMRELDGTNLTQFASGSTEHVLLNNDGGGAWEHSLEEAPWMIHRGSYYYLFYSGAFIDTTYAEGVARATTLTGIYTRAPGNLPILQSNSTWGGPGHGAFIEDADGTVWFYYHARHQDNPDFGRVQMLDKVTWTSAGWPSFGNGGTPSTTRQPGPRVIAPSGTGLLSVPGTAGDDQFLISRNGSDASLLDIRVNGILTESVPFDEVQAVTLSGTGGNDVLTLDYSRGEAIPGAGINFAGGTGTDTLRIVGASDDDDFHLSAGELTHGSGIVTFSLNTLDLESGTFDLDGNVGSLALDVATAQVGIHVNQQLGALNLSAGANVALDSGKALVLRASALSIDPGATLELSDNDFLLDYTGASPLGTWTGSAYSGVSGLIQSGRLTSSADTHNTTLAVAEASDIFGISGTQTALWDGQTIDSTALLIKYTYAGDANLDGRINIDDYGRIDANVGRSGSVFGWYNGDFNFDGKINIDDYGLIDSVIGAQGPVL